VVRGHAAAVGDFEERPAEVCDLQTGAAAVAPAFRLEEITGCGNLGPCRRALPAFSVQFPYLVAIWGTTMPGMPPESTLCAEKSRRGAGIPPRSARESGLRREKGTPWRPRERNHGPADFDWQ
jgi:hypothetical protein